jgi:hypothetical protein
MPLIQQPCAPKQRRLRALFDFSVGLSTSRTESLEGAMKELQQDINAALVKQTEILIKILGLLRERNMNFD